MRSLILSSAALAALLATAATSSAGTLIPIVPVTGSSSTNVFGINDSKNITGSYISSNDGLEHGYTGPLSGTNYTLFDAPSGTTEPRAISNDGTITGFGNNDGNILDYQPFERTPSGTLTNVTKKGKPLNYIAQGISNATDEFAGSYENNSGIVEGYLGANAKFKKAVKISITNTGVGPRGVDSAGDIVGWYYDSNGVQNGFLISGGTATTIDYPDNTAVYTVLEGINDNGEITGQWDDTNGVVHAFSYEMSTGKFKSITVPNATSFTQAWGVNSAGWVAIGSDQGYFVYCPGKKSKCHANGIETTETEIHVALKDMPHVPCVNSCLLPTVRANKSIPAAATGKAAPPVSGRPQPMQP